MLLRLDIVPRPRAVQLRTASSNYHDPSARSSIWLRAALTSFAPYPSLDRLNIEVEA
ncbi:hypothetical protein X729_10175 [Mesorhizobium sp. L103C131B0]|nr:hypothetical protein X729_10175 [Mesorhizobium sp. L103C131B0]